MRLYTHYMPICGLIPWPHIVSFHAFRVSKLLAHYTQSLENGEARINSLNEHRLNSHNLEHHFVRSHSHLIPEHLRQWQRRRCQVIFRSFLLYAHFAAKFIYSFGIRQNPHFMCLCHQIVTSHSLLSWYIPFWFAAQQIPFHFFLLFFDSWFPENLRFCV